MPELPEVDAAARELRRALKGRAIRRIVIAHAALRRSLSPAAARRLSGRVVTEVRRRGKHQFIELDDGTVLHAHFRMTGDWTVHHAGDAPRFARLTIECDDDSAVSLDDPRALSSVRIVADPDAMPRLGPEADDPSVAVGYLRGAFARRSGSIKPLLMDQAVIAGLGNIYAAEALWHARIDPRTAANRLSTARLLRLLAGIREALRVGRSRPARYASGDLSGLVVYDREGERCPRCGKRIRRILQAGRSTYFCPGCQK